MKVLLQRVDNSSVSVAGEKISEIGIGILVFIGIEKCDNLQIAEKMIDKILKFRVFSDSDGKMNLSVKETANAILVVS